MTNAPRPRLLALAAVAALGLTGIASAQHGPAKVAGAQDSVPARKIVPMKEATDAKPEKQEADARKLLRIGDQAPMPHLARILKGDTEFEPFPEGGVTVMEFWATWCGPCRAGMPHISELQEKYADRDVTIVGVTREKPEVVEAFLAKPEWDDKTRYTMALDDEGRTSTAYMKAANRNGIPCAFIVDQEGRVAWIGHPMTMDQPLAKIVAGDWDVMEARKEYEEAQRSQQVMMQVRRSMMDAQRTGDYTDAIKTLDRAMKQMPGNRDLEMMRFKMMIGPAADPEGYEIGWKLFKANRDDAMMLNEIAWYVLDDASVGDRDLVFAMAVAKAANEAAGGNDAAILDTLARAYFEQGDVDTAIKYQEKAVGKADGPMADQLRKVLEQYRAAASKRPV